MQLYHAKAAIEFLEDSLGDGSLSFIALPEEGVHEVILERIVLARVFPCLGSTIASQELEVVIL